MSHIGEQVLASPFDWVNHIAGLQIDPWQFYFQACGCLSETISRSAAFAPDSSCPIFLKPGMQVLTASCCKHHAIAHCAISRSLGTSSLRISSTCLSLLSVDSCSRPALTSSAPNTAPGLYLPLKKPLASGTLANTPRSCLIQDGKTRVSGFLSSRLYTT